jgi:hypothetical protein
MAETGHGKSQELGRHRALNCHPTIQVRSREADPGGRSLSSNDFVSS